jgi:3-deoxy-D-manno-octulosonic-acid transferase
MISREDAERVVSLGADPARVVVTGNAKYGWLSARCQATDLSVPSRRLNLAGSPFIVAGSVRSGEEDMLFRAFARTRAQAEGAVLLAAPRHLRQVEKWRRAALYHGFKADCWSRIKCREPELAVIILDEMGPLFELYGLADSAFVGGSLVDKGGHNPLEPAVWGKPLAYGPHMQDFKDALACLPANMARMVASGEQLADFWLYCLSRREMAAVWQRKGQAMAASLNQASRRAAQLIKQHLV